jgi:hypothetical protein
VGSGKDLVGTFRYNAGKIQFLSSKFEKQEVRQLLLFPGVFA